MSRHMTLCYLGPSSSLPVSGFGRVGHPLIAIYLCGWPLITDVGLRVDWLGEGYLTS